MKTKLLDAYFAGLIDGEGNVSIYPQRKNNNMRPVIAVAMTCKKTLDAIHAHFGGCLAITKTNPKCKPQWKWQVTYTKAKEIAKIIRPYLITKAEKADDIIAYIPRKRGRPPEKSGLVGRG